jgi:hypothetical protein
MWNALSRLSIESAGKLLWTQWWNFGLKMYEFLDWLNVYH